MYNFIVTTHDIEFKFDFSIIEDMKVDSNLKTSERPLSNANNLIDSTLKTKTTNRFDFQNDLLTLKTKSIGKDQKKLSYGRKFVEIDLNSYDNDFDMDSYLNLEPVSTLVQHLQLRTSFEGFEKDSYLLVYGGHFLMEMMNDAFRSRELDNLLKRRFRLNFMAVVSHKVL